MIYSGGELRADIPDVDVASFVLARAAELGEKPALIDGSSGRVLSYTELERLVRSFAAGLAARGFGKGDTFAIYMPNVPEYAVAFYGVVAAGGRCTTASPLYTAGELSHQLIDSDARMLLTIPQFADVAREAAGRTGSCEVFVLGGVDGEPSFSELLGDPETPPEVEIDPAADIAVILYSSGTTGLSKGVMLSHRNLVANMVQAVPAVAVSQEDVVIAVLPFFHVYGLCGIMSFGLVVGATLVTMPRFELEQFLDLLERYRVTRGHMVPPIALALARHPAVDSRDVSALRHIFCGAAPLGADLAEDVAQRIGCGVSQIYGMSETAATHLVPPFSVSKKPGSVGPPIPGTECRLIDPDTGEDARPGERGELWVRGPQVMLGYLGNPQATAATIDEDGWLHTGDVAVVDEDGWFAIVDRVKELIKYKGHQVAPAELEAILIAHPQVADCAVIGVPDDEAGELPKAFVVPAGDLDSGELMAFVAEQVAPHKRIRAIELVREIPKSPSGKILRRLLRDRERVL